MRRKTRKEERVQFVITKLLCKYYSVDIRAGQRSTMPVACDGIEV